MNDPQQLTAAPVDVFARGQELWKEAVAKLNSLVAHLQRQERVRKAFAYLLKGIVVFGGLAIALGLELPYSRIVGITMMVAVTIDGFVSNHKSLLRIAEAAAASEALREQVTTAHQMRQLECLSRRDLDQAAGNRCLHELNIEITNAINTGTEQIRVSLRNADIEQLRLLAIEHKQAEAALKLAAHNRPPGG
jgi:hypothetical protein